MGARENETMESKILTGANHFQKPLTGKESIKDGKTDTKKIWLEMFDKNAQASKSVKGGCIGHTTI